MTELLEKVKRPRGFDVSPIFSAAVIYEIEGGVLKVLVVLDDGKTKLPGGCADFLEKEGRWETAEEALYREAEEEVNIFIRDILCSIGEVVIHEGAHTKNFFLVDDNWEENIPGAKGSLPMEWLRIEEVRARLLTSHREAFEKALWKLRKLRKI